MPRVFPQVKKVIITAASVIDRPWYIKLNFSYNPVIIKMIKYYPGYKWDKDEKAWSVPREVFELFLCHEFEKEGFEVKYTPLMNEAEVFNLQLLSEGLKDHQKLGVKNALEKGMHLFAYETGLGKTRTAIETAKIIGARRIIFITVAKGLDDIQEEFTKWWPECLQGSAIIEFPQVDKPVVLFGTWHETKKLQLQSCDILIYDEIEYAKNPETVRGKFARDLRAKNFDAYVLGLSASPTPEGANDFYHVFDLLCPGIFGGYWAYANVYGEIESNNYGSRLAGINSIRDFELSQRLQYWCQYQSKFGQAVPDIHSEQYLVPSDNIEITGLTELSPKQIQEYLAKYQFDKVNRAMATIIDRLDNDSHKHQIVLTWKKETAARIAATLEAEFEQPVFVITGDIPIPKRKALIKEIAKLPESIIVASMESIAESINGLVFISNIIVAELLYKARVYVQVFGRFCRLNSKHKHIYITFILLEKTIEVDIANRVAEKFAVTSSNIGVGTAETTIGEGLGTNESAADFANRLGHLEFSDLGGLDASDW